MTGGTDLARSLEAVEARVSAACSAAGRRRPEVLLVAVSKTRPASDVAALHALGVRDVGESRDAEARAKAESLAELDLRWHFVGTLQSNKADSVASYADVVHSVDRLSLVRALSRGAARTARRLDVLLQVSLDGDPTRGGVREAELAALGERVAGAEGLRLAGVMAVAPREADPERAFAELASISDRLRRDHPTALEISAGMSGDLEAAIASGATMVRVGTALFGARPPLLR
jgi:pyridoxal phosphate enzyme (YggS family)